MATSVKGNNQTVLFMIVTTNGFAKFNSWRKYASYIGIAPFSNTSKTSIIGRTKVRNLANKNLKLFLVYLQKPAIQNYPEIKK